VEELNETWFDEPLEQGVVEAGLTRGRLVRAAVGTFGGAMLVGVPASWAASPKVKLTGDAAKGVIRWDTEAEAVNINPIGSTNLPPIRRPGTWITNGLMRPTAKPGVYAFDLARSFKSAKDGMSWEFKLRSGVVWSDGSPFTSADVKATYDAVLDASYASIWRNQITGLVGSVQAPDPLTVRFVMRAPGTWIMNAFAQIPIVKASEARDKDKLAVAPTGTGAFYISERRSGDRLILKANGKYFRKGMPRVYGLNYVVAPDPSARIANLVSGQTALTSDIQYSQLSLLKGKNVKLYDVAGAPTRLYFYFNVNREPWFRDYNFRNALSFAIDRQTVVNLVFAGRATPAQGQYSPNTVFFDPSIKKFGPRADVDKARKLLSQARAKPTRPVVITIAGASKIARDTATILQANWQAIGVQTEIEALDTTVASAKFRSRQTDVYLLNDFLGTGPAWTPSYLASSYTNGAVFNFSDPDPDLDKKMRTAISGLDRAEIKAALTDIQRYDIDQQRIVGICHPHYLEAQGVPLAGYQVMPLGNVPFTVEEARIG
jgi:peptide/nickel transport system substrate-binding protein